MAARAVSAGVLVAAVLTGCGGAATPDERPRPSPEPRVKIRVTRDDGSMPRGCGPRATALRVVRFLAAFNRGDAAALDRMIAGVERFQWFSASVRGSHPASVNATGARSVTNIDPAPETSERPRVLRWFAERHRAGERMRLLDISVVRTRTWLPVDEELAGILYVVERRAPDIDRLEGRNRLASGKGGISCADGAVLVWSMGLDTRRRPPRTVCPRLARRRVTACTAL